MTGCAERLTSLPLSRKTLNNMNVKQMSLPHMSLCLVLPAMDVTRVCHCWSSVCVCACASMCVSHMPPLSDTEPDPLLVVLNIYKASVGHGVGWWGETLYRKTTTLFSIGRCACLAIHAWMLPGYASAILGVKSPPPPIVVKLPGNHTCLVREIVFFD